MPRAAIKDFQLGNPLYKGAQVTFYTVAGGLKTATKAALYAAASGSTELANPQKLDSHGKFRQPVYIDVPVIGAVQGLTVPSHDTGIISPAPTFRVDAEGELQYSFDNGITWNGTGDSPFLDFTNDGVGAVTRSFHLVLRSSRRLSDYNTFAEALTASAGRTLILDVQGNVTVPGGQSINSPTRIVQEPGCVLRPSMASGDSVFCRINSSDVEWIRPVIDGSQLPAISSVNKYMILVSPTSGQISRVSLFKPKIQSCQASDGNVGATNLLVTHAIYCQQVLDLEIDIDLIEDVSGAAIFWNRVTRGKIRNGLIDDTGWYSINLDYGCEHFDIGYTKISATGNTAARYWGGSINLMSTQGQTKNRKGRLFRVLATGPHNYGAVFRMLSCDDLDVEQCEALDCTRGTNPSAPAGGMAYFGIQTRGVSAADKQDPPTNNRIHRCKGRADGTGHRFIEVQNPYHTANPIINLEITENECRSPDETNDYFDNAIVLHGQSGGIKNARVLNNPHLEVKTASGTTFPGGLCFIATDANGQVQNVVEGGNSLVNIRTSGWGAGDIGCYVGDRVGPFVRQGTDFFDNFFYGTRLTGTLTTVRNINHQVVLNLAAGGVELLLNTQPSQVDQTNRADTTANRPASGVRVNYELRYNTSTKLWEYFAGDDGDWVSLKSQQDSLDQATSAQLADITHAINTKNKYRNKVVRNSTTGLRVFANGATAGDIWITADAATSYTPV